MNKNRTKKGPSNGFAPVTGGRLLFALLLLPSVRASQAQEVKDGFSHEVSALPRHTDIV